MRHQKKGKTLGRKRAPRRAMFRNLATSFVLYEQIKTTKAKAQELRPMVEKIITLGKENSLHHKRQVAKVLYLNSAVDKVFEVLGPRFVSRPGGYTRIVKLKPRVSDGAEIAILELVEKTTATTTVSANKKSKTKNKKEALTKKEVKPKKTS